MWLFGAAVRSPLKPLAGALLPGKVQSRLALGGRSPPVVCPTTHQASRAHPRQNHPRTSRRVGVLSKNTNELEIRVPGRFGLEVAGCYVSTIWKPHEYFDLTVIKPYFHDDAVTRYRVRSNGARHKGAIQSSIFFGGRKMRMVMS